MKQPTTAGPTTDGPTTSAAPFHDVRLDYADEGFDEDAPSHKSTPEGSINNDATIHSVNSQAILVDMDILDIATSLEKDPDIELRPVPPSRLTSQMSERPKTEWASLWVAYIVMFMSAAQFSVYLSSMWPYLQQIDKIADETFFGYIIASFSVAQMIASPIAGWASQKMKKSRPCIMLGVALGGAASFAYCFVEAFPTNRRWVLLVIRFLAGLGSGNAAVIRSYTAQASTLEDRARAMSLSTGSFALGVVAGPGIQAMFTPLKFPGYSWGNFYLNMYTAPGFFCVVVSMLNLLLLFTMFKESNVGVHKMHKTKNPFNVLPKFDRIGAGVCIWCWFCMLFTLITGETIGSPYTMTMFNWTGEQATFYNSIIYAVSGGISFVMYMTIGVKFYHKLHERFSLIAGLITVAIYFLMTFSWPGIGGSINYQITCLQNATHLNHTQLPNSTVLSTTWMYNTMSSITPTSMYFNGTNGTNDWPTCGEPVGCDPTFDWCRYTTSITLVQYLIAYSILSFGFPLANIVLAVMYSKIIGPRRQGTMQGLYVFAGSAARTLGPVFISAAFQRYGPRIPWIVQTIIIFLTIAVVAVFYKRLVPLNAKPTLKAGDKLVYKDGVLVHL